jgi:uncharacterized protein (TIGR03437 family)
VIVLYGTGFGDANPPLPADRVFSGAAPLAHQVSVSIGYVPAVVQFAGMSSNGLCQFNVVVPVVPDGDQELIAVIQSYRTQSAFIPCTLVTASRPVIKAPTSCGN